MSLEQSIDKLTAAIEAATGVLVTLGAVGKAASPTPAAAPTPRPPGRPPKASPAASAPAPAPAEPVDEGLDESGGGLDDDGGLGDDGADASPSLSAEDAKAAVLAYRDKAIKTLGKEEGLNVTRALMKKYVAALDDISADNAAEIHKAFTAAVAKIKAK